MEVPEPVRRQARHPFSELPPNPEVERVDVGGAVVGFNPWPGAQITTIEGSGPDDVGGAVERARAEARTRGKTIIAWWVAKEHDHLAPELEALGVVNRDTPGFEATENAMVLVEPPRGSVPEGVEVGVVDTWEEFLGAVSVAREVFGFPEVPEPELRRRYEESLKSRHLGQGVFAAIDGKIVANGFAAFGTAGINLFGGAVLPEARGRGVYGALVHARWEMAVQRGTPALTVQAGRMSMPILEKVGFRFVDAIRVFVDELG